MKQLVNHEKNSVYIFSGDKFLEYIDVTNIKKNIKEKTGFEEAQTLEPFPSYYERFLTERYSEKEILEKEFFESIFYGRLTNVFINKINDSSVSIDDFKEGVKRLINFTNSHNNLPQDIKELMTEDGFYIMDQVFTTERNTFLAGFDYSSNKNDEVENARFLIVQVVPTKQNRGQLIMNYQVCAVELDYSNQLFVCAIRNMDSLIKKDETEDSDEEFPKTVTSFYKKISNIFIKNLGIQVYINHQEDRTSMFQMCKDLDTIMLDELRQEVDEKTSDTIKVMVDELGEQLFGKAIVPLVNKDDLNRRFKSLLLATYLEVMTEDEDIKLIAKSKQLIGYPTKVAFKSKNASKGATGTSGANEPVATSIMFHSLYTDFQEALELPNWSLSWFTDIGHQTDSMDVVQTSIDCKTEYFKVTFKNRLHIGKDLFRHVVRKLSEYRNYIDKEE